MNNEIMRNNPNEDELVIYVDTRQHRGKHENINNYFKEQNIKTIPSKLSVGDYESNQKDKKVSVDTKRDWNEVGKNLLNRDDKERFLREVKRASDEGKQLIILVEDDVELSQWKNPRATYDAPAIKKKIDEFFVQYPHVHFIHCAKKDTGFNIVGFLTGALEYDERKIEEIEKEQEEFYDWLMENYPDGLPKADNL